MRSLFLQAPSFDGYDGGAGARYQMKREVKSFWYPTWLAQTAAMVEGSKLMDRQGHLHLVAARVTNRRTGRVVELRDETGQPRWRDARP